uniref:PNPLA domain-containing protein n=1 Tax=viral metagenome TaxID=1070528 RepID=A0A6C0EC39_9ZZZZ
MNNQLNLNEFFNTLCLAGGGVSGIIYLGILNYLDNNNYLNLSLFDKFCGTSIGAAISFLFALNYTITEIMDFILEFNIKTLEFDYNIDNIVNIFNNFGLDEGKKFNIIFSNFIFNKYDIYDITFKELFDLTKKKLLIIGTNLTTASEELFSIDTTPDMSVLIALKISMCVPLLFSPVNYNSYYYLDGGLINNFPIDYCNIETTLGICLVLDGKQKNIKIDNIFSLLKNSIKIILQSIGKQKNINNNNNIIKVNQIFNNNFDFNIDLETKKELIEYGEKCAIEFIKTFIEEKELKKNSTELNNLINSELIINKNFESKFTQTEIQN